MLDPELQGLAEADQPGQLGGGGGLVGEGEEGAFGATATVGLQAAHAARALTDRARCR